MNSVKSNNLSFISSSTVEDRKFRKYNSICILKILGIISSNIVIKPIITEFRYIELSTVLSVHHYVIISSVSVQAHDIRFPKNFFFIPEEYFVSAHIEKFSNFNLE